MLKLVGIEEILENVLGLSHQYLEGEANQVTLQAAFRAFLMQIQPRVPQPTSLGLCIKSHQEEVAPLLAIFKQESILDDFQEVFDKTLVSEKKETVGRIRQALQIMENLIPLFNELINIVIHTIFTAPSKMAGGGSTSAAIGCIWLDAREHWSEQDLLEFLIHETTHNLVFLDELCHKHYESYKEVAKQENFASSAILAKLRPLDKVFHSIIVSTEVLSFREEHLGHPQKPCLHPPTDILLEQTKRSIDSILNMPSVERLLTNRSKSLLKKCMQKLEMINCVQACAF